MENKKKSQLCVSQIKFLVKHVIGGVNKIICVGDKNRLFLRVQSFSIIKEGEIRP